MAIYSVDVFSVVKTPDGLRDGVLVFHSSPDDTTTNNPVTRQDSHSHLSIIILV